MELDFERRTKDAPRLPFGHDLGPTVHLVVMEGEVFAVLKRMYDQDHNELPSFAAPLLQDVLFRTSLSDVGAIPRARRDVDARGPVKSDPDAIRSGAGLQHGLLGLARACYPTRTGKRAVAAGRSRGRLARGRLGREGQT